MSEDLEPIMKSWPPEAGSIQVRTVQGKDGRQKLQLRLDLGILQMEMHGRPDGQNPFGCGSLLEYYEKLAERFQEDNERITFKLGPEDCLKLQQEGIQYYHRYLAFFQLQNFKDVIRDTERNLRLLDFIAQHAENPETAVTSQHLRPYVLMMLTRARGMLAIQNKDYALALKYIEWGIQEIRSFFETYCIRDPLEKSPEIDYLQNWIKEIQEQRPLTPKEKLKKQMLEAISKEDYERAGRLRDAIDELG